MKFLVDAQLPRRATGWFAAAGCDAVHTLDLPRRNCTTDAEIIEQADRDQRVVVTKDSDFVDSHTLQGRPAKLLLVSTGNLGNTELELLMVPLIPLIASEFLTLFPRTRPHRHRHPQLAQAAVFARKAWTHSGVFGEIVEGRVEVFRHRKNDAFAGAKEGFTAAPGGGTGTSRTAAPSSRVMTTSSPPKA